MSRVTNDASNPACDLDCPRRNRYFYGKLLDAYHFELESAYFNAKRHLLNRLVSGWGVVCGLRVLEAEEDEGAVIICPGVAIDPWGREIIVPEESQPIPVPEELLADTQVGFDTAAYSYNVQETGPEEHILHLVLCYHECETEPAPVLAGDCSSHESCEASVICERYEAAYRWGCVVGFREDADIQDFITRRKGGYTFNYERLVDWVSEDCRPCPDDPCVPLANVHFEREADDEPWQVERIDLTARPIVYANDVLLELLWSLMTEKPSSRGRK